MKTSFSNLPGRLNAGVDTDYSRRRALKSRRRALKIRLLSVCIGVAIALCGAAVYGQMRIRYFSVAANGGPAPSICGLEGALINTYVVAYPHPDQWTWIVACEESDWKALAQHLGVETAGQEIFAETDRHHHITYVRGYALLHPPEHYDVTPEHVVAHEMAHVVLDSGDEDLAEREAARWIKERAKRLLAIAEKR